jgi:sigma-B regulation protein RsbU (phosphoserine phosphatase)
MKKLSDCRLLLVDDTKANLDILVAGLKGEYQLSLALNGETALKLAARALPDLILLDVMMPGLDGYEVCRRLRQMPETAEVPIIFLSALDEAQNKARGFEAGANDYVTKPFDMLEVKARVRSLLKAKAYNDAVKEQMAGELRVARQIQMGMVPHDFSSLEARFGIGLVARLEPAREVGGDLYCAFNAAAGRLVLVVGDVSGKGIPASLFMVRTISLVRLLARDDPEPERILARLNDELAADNPSDMFVTLVCAVFDPATRALKLANAGQTRPLLLRAGAPPRYLLDQLGTAVGLEPGLTFERVELMLEPEDELVLYTDGVTEAFNNHNECYGDARLLADLAPLTGQGPADVAAGLLGKVRSFAGDAPQSDDIAVLVLRVGRASASSNHAKSGVVSLELYATSEEVMRAVEALRTFGREHGISEETLFGMTLAVEECGSNIVRHTWAGDATKRFRATFECLADRLTVVLRDYGPAFDPTAVPPQTIGEDAEEGRLGGWGLEFVRHYLDQLEYAREGEENVLRLVKRLPARLAE